MSVKILKLLGVSDAECIAGDLHEERVLLSRESGDVVAARWYAWQVWRLCWRSFAERTATITIVIAPPLVVLQCLWKALFDYLCVFPAPGLIAVNASCLLTGAILALPSRRTFGLGLICGGLAVAVSMGPAAYPHLLAGCVAIPAGALAAQIRKGLA